MIDLLTSLRSASKEVVGMADDVNAALRRWQSAVADTGVVVTTPSSGEESTGAPVFDGHGDLVGTLGWRKVKGKFGFVYRPLAVDGNLQPWQSVYDCSLAVRTAILLPYPVPPGDLPTGLEPGSISEVVEDLLVQTAALRAQLCRAVETDAQTSPLR